MVKTKMSLMEKFLKMATSETELAGFFSTVGDNISKTLYNNGTTVYESIEKGVRRFFSINPLTNTVKQGTVVSSINKAGKKITDTKVVFHDGPLTSVNATKVFDNKFGVGTVTVNAGGKNSVIHNPLNSVTRI